MFEFLYNKVIVNIVVTGSTSIVYVELLNSKGVIKSDEATFNTTSLNKEMFHFITSYTKDSPFHYISILDTSKEQGAVPTCSKISMSHFHDFSASEYKCVDDKWTYYTSKNDIYALEKKYEKVGVDFIFSPFVLLYNFFQDKINEQKAMYILIEESRMALCVFENSELRFAQYLDMHIESGEEMEDDVLIIDDEDLEDDLLEEESSIDLDDLDALDNVEDFGNIEDLDSLEDIDEFSESQDVENEYITTQKAAPVSSEPEGFNQDYQRFSLIQNAIDNFYKDERYESEFIESVYIADSVGVSKDLKTYLEEEMFLSVYIRSVDLVHELCRVTKMELK